MYRQIQGLRIPLNRRVPAERRVTCGVFHGGANVNKLVPRVTVPSFPLVSKHQACALCLALLQTCRRGFPEFTCKPKQLRKRWIWG